MNITQRKIISGYTRAFQSDHRRAKQDDADVAGLCFSGSSVTMTTSWTPSARSCATTWGTVKLPSNGWPPVMATASL